MRLGLRLDAGSSLHLDTGLALALVALAVGRCYAAALQFTLLKDRTVANLNSADLVIPGLTYLLALVLGRAGERTTWISFVMIGGALVSRVLADILPVTWPGWGRALRLLRGAGVWWLNEPSVRIARWLLQANLMGLLVSLAVFLPVEFDLIRWLSDSPEERASGRFGPQVALLIEHGNWLWFLVVFVVVSQLLAMTFLAILVRGILQDELLARLGLRATELAHDLKNQFASGIAFLDLLERKRLPPDMVHRLSAAVQRKLRRGARLVQAFLDASKGEKPFLCKYEVTKLVPFFSGVEAEFKEDLLLGKATFRIQLDSTVTPEVEFSLDQDRVCVILENLVDNAKRAWLGDPSRDRSLERLEMILTAALDKGTLQLCFRDNGPGMHAEPTDAVDAWISGSPGGYGLGTYLIRRYVAAHNGDGPDWDPPKKKRHSMDGCEVHFTLKEPTTARVPSDGGV